MACVVGHWGRGCVCVDLSGDPRGGENAGVVVVEEKKPRLPRGHHAVLHAEALEW